MPVVHGATRSMYLNLYNSKKLFLGNVYLIISRKILNLNSYSILTVCGELHAPKVEFQLVHGNLIC